MVNGLWASLTTVRILSHVLCIRTGLQCLSPCTCTHLISVVANGEKKLRYCQSKKILCVCVCTFVQIDSSATSRVDFELTETPVKSRGTRTNPPTPHPSAQRPSLNPLTRALEEREAEEELLLSQAPDAEPRKKGHEEEPPAPKTKVAVSMPVTTPTKASAGGASRGQKKAKKAKQPVDLGV